MTRTIQALHGERWRDLSVKEQMRLGSAVDLEISAVLLLLVAFILTLKIGWDVIASAALLLATACALFGLGIFVKTSLIEIDTKVEKRLRDIEQYSINRSLE